MTIINAILVGIFVMSIVFLVLVALSFMIRVQSFLFNTFFEEEKNDKNDVIQVIDETNEKIDLNTSSGELKLIGVDEKTAAMVIAIISDKLETPIGELQFKSIKALDV